MFPLEYLLLAGMGKKPPDLRTKEISEKKEIFKRKMRIFSHPLPNILELYPCFEPRILPVARIWGGIPGVWAGIPGFWGRILGFWAGIPGFWGRIPGFWAIPGILPRATWLCQLRPCTGIP